MKSQRVVDAAGSNCQIMLARLTATAVAKLSAKTSIRRNSRPQLSQLTMTGEDPVFRVAEQYMPAAEDNVYFGWQLASAQYGQQFLGQQEAMYEQALGMQNIACVDTDTETIARDVERCGFPELAADFRETDRWISARLQMIGGLLGR